MVSALHPASVILIKKTINCITGAVAPLPYNSQLRLYVYIYIYIYISINGAYFITVNHAGRYISFISFKYTEREKNLRW